MAGKGGGPWEQFKDEKVTNQEDWRSGSQWDCFSEMDVCWMTCFCGPCMISREWNASKQLKSYSQNWPVCLALTFCGCFTPCVVANIRTTVRKIGDASSYKDNPAAWIKGSFAEDLLCAWCCGPCTTCHIGRELKARSYPCGTICQRMES